MSLPEIEVLTSHVSKIFRIDDVTAGDPREWIVRYRGQLLGEDSVAAYDQLAEAVRGYNLTPLFRKGEEGRQVIFLVQSLPKPNVNARIYINVILFVLTVISMLLTGVEIPPSAVPADGSFPFLYLLQNILTGWPFALSMMGILFAHEMGHYIACRIYKVPATLPYFLPAPLISPLGTFGAFIVMRGIPKNKRVLFDVGVAGPIAGLIVAIPVLFIGLSLSPLGPIEHAPAGMSGFLEGNSIFYLFSKYVVFGQLLPHPVSTGGLSQAVYWLQYFLTGAPIPFGGVDVQLHSVALAGWAGLLVTALNLVPVGTLDGGHVAYGLFGDKARKIFPFAIGALIALSVLPSLLTLSLAAFNSSWILWVFILFWLGKVRAQPLDEITELDSPRRALGFVMLIVFVLLFTPIPMVMY
ncbi:MAG: site-2 protease family protein [Anaerolineales bacterium]|nr:MAG: site-2 protease family protein [Anaerolineales bacterium]